MELSDKQISEKTPSPYIAGLLCRCPRCGKGKLFEGFLTLKSKCDVCGLDFSFADDGDGPAIFVIMHRGSSINLRTGSARCCGSFDPDSHALAPLFIALQYHHKASQGKLVPRADE
jgi:hypothetical protein